MEARVQRAMVWCGPAMLVLWIGAFIFIAGFIPPSHPALSADAVVQLYSDNTTGIRLGMVIAMAGCALLVPYGAVISGQLKRIDGAKALADTQFVSSALLSLEFITPIGIWMAVAYRFDDRAADLTRALHDVGWILFMTVIWSLFVQLICIGVAILIDRKPKPTFPRWIAYLNFWIALLIIPAGLVLFFKDGPFAWNGLVGLYVPLVAWVIWFICMTSTMHSNLTQQIVDADEASPPAG